ncbi:MAG TPA: zf-HC2 domain-containing protein [Myxococcaceae bacterium]|nr:zf-HC2 domain-containing protein [Myxococcaceae bacterium]
MFTCKNSIVDHLLEFLDGEMSEELEKQLIEHLEGCPPCQDYVRTYRATPGLCKRAWAKKMPDGLSGKLTEFLRAKIPQK